MLPTPEPVSVESKSTQTTKIALPFRRYFTSPDKDVYDMFEWETRSATIKDEMTGQVIFQADDLEFPKSWSQNCTNIVAGKYFRVREGLDGKLYREKSVREMVSRVVDTLTVWGMKNGYFPTVDDAETFRAELAYLLLSQRMAFNSPVWFNLGTKGGRVGEEQCSACFINSIDDTLDSIAELSKTEAKLFKGGSGSGVNYSPLRSSLETLSGGGTASGPVPFIAKDDSNGGAIKSGGTTRRAAKMSILNVTHPDILEFIACKAKAEKMAHALVDAGFEADFRARFGVYQSLPFQNANHSVRVTDDFMMAVITESDWHLLGKDGTVLKTVRATELWNAICDAAWWCADPGLQFDTLINKMHTCPAHGRINASNPCSEYMHLDDSACNLASLNLRKFQRSSGSLNVDEFCHAVDMSITAMDIIVDNAAYPTDKIGRNAKEFRQLGLGYTNLGAFFMAQGLSYDSFRARTQCAFITAILTGRAYARSAEMAGWLYPFGGWWNNKQAMRDVMRAHQANLGKFPNWHADDQQIRDAAVFAWQRAIKLGDLHGYRNAQATVLAPTGTISFLMDADTTGIEPDAALVKVKKLVGGGDMIIVNHGVTAGLQALGYNGDQITEISAYVIKNGSMVGAPHIRNEDLGVFDTALPDKIGKRSLSIDAHILMMAAAQPFISGAISKTCNMPNSATREDISRAYMLAWQNGLKAIAIYRDGCKRSQPLQNAQVKDEDKRVPSANELQLIDQVNKLVAELDDLKQPKLHRRKLPDECRMIRHKFKIGEHKGYLKMGMYPDGTLGEIFIKMNKEGSTVSGLMDTIATLTSISLQYGVPLEALVKKFKYTAFEPHGWTDNTYIKHASSLVDYIFRVLEYKFLGQQSAEVVEGVPAAELKEQGFAVQTEPVKTANGHHEVGHKICPECGHGTRRTGACETCPNCGWNGGCG